LKTRQLARYLSSDEVKGGIKLGISGALGGVIGAGSTWGFDLAHQKVMLDREVNTKTTRQAVPRR